MEFTNTLKEESPKSWEEFIKQYIFSIQDENVLSLTIGDSISKSFESLPFDYQQGVLLSFLEKYQIRPVVDSMNDYWGVGVYYYEGKWKNLGGMNYNTELKTRAQAYQKAIIKGFKLLEGI